MEKRDDPPCPFLKLGKTDNPPVLLEGRSVGTFARPKAKDLVKTDMPVVALHMLSIIPACSCVPGRVTTSRLLLHLDPFAFRAAYPFVIMGEAARCLAHRQPQCSLCDHFGTD